MAGEMEAAALRDLLTTTKDGDWGKDAPAEGLVPYRVIRGTDFPSVRAGDTSSVPIRYLSGSTVYRRTLAADDILIETAGGSPDRPTGRSLLIKQKLLSSLDLPATCASFARFLRVDHKKAEPSYVFWFLQFLYASGQMEEHQVQHTGVARFQYTKFAESQEIPLPHRKEQRAIAHILGTLDDKIELNRRMNETLEAMARALFQSWFVDFDPVRAKAEGCDPGLPKPLADLFPGSFEDSELGEVPKGWKVGTLADLGSLNPESWSTESRPATLQYVDLSNTKWGRIEHVTTYARDNAPSRAQRVLRPGDTIVGTVRPGNGAYVLVADNGLTGSTGFAVLRPQRPEYVEFVYLAATTPENIEALAHLADGGAYPAVRPDVVASTKVVRAPHAVIAAFSRAALPSLVRMGTCKRESRSIASLRDALLPKLISGELRSHHVSLDLSGAS